MLLLDQEASYKGSTCNTFCFLFFFLVNLVTLLLMDL